MRTLALRSGPPVPSAICALAIRREVVFCCERNGRNAAAPAKSRMNANNPKYLTRIMFWCFSRKAQLLRQRRTKRFQNNMAWGMQPHWNKHCGKSVNESFVRGILHGRGSLEESEPRRRGRDAEDARKCTQPPAGVMRQHGSNEATRGPGNDPSESQNHENAVRQSVTEQNVAKQQAKKPSAHGPRQN